MKDIINKCECSFIHEEVVGKVKNKMPEDEKLYDLAELFKVLVIQLELKFYMHYLKKKCVYVI